MIASDKLLRPECEGLLSTSAFPVAVQQMEELSKRAPMAWGGGDLEAADNTHLVRDSSLVKRMSRLVANSFQRRKREEEEGMQQSSLTMGLNAVLYTSRFI